MGVEVGRMWKFYRRIQAADPEEKHWNPGDFTQTVLEDTQVQSVFPISRHCFPSSHSLAVQSYFRWELTGSSDSSIIHKKKYRVLKFQFKQNKILDHVLVGEALSLQKDNGSRDIIYATTATLSSYCIKKVGQRALACLHFLSKFKLSS